MSQITTTSRFSFHVPMAVAMLLAVLSACSSAPSRHATHETEKSTAAKSGEDGIFPESQEITTASTITKHRLSISYSLESIHAKHEDMLKLTLILRNFDNRYRHVQPRIDLRDADGKTVKAYTLKEFSSLFPRSAAAQTDELNWIKSSYRIPPKGIAMGQLVFYGKKFNYPLKLSIWVSKDKYEFTAK